MTNLCRISVVGSSGSGKTFLAQQLAGLLEVPVYELDQLKRSADGSTLPAEQFRDLVDGLTLREAWIIDGHYRDVRHLIWQRSDAVIWLNYPLSLVAYRLLRRFIRKKRGKADPSTREFATSQQLAQSEPDTSASWRQRLRRLQRTLQERRKYPVLLSSPTCGHIAVIELKSPRRTGKWLSNFGDNRVPGIRCTPVDREAEAHNRSWLIHPDYDSGARSGNLSVGNRCAPSASIAKSPLRDEG